LIFNGGIFINNGERYSSDNYIPILGRHF